MGASPFGGNSPGRPATANPDYQFAGTQRQLSGPERALIAARRWETKQRIAGPAERRAFQESAGAWAQGGYEGPMPTIRRRAAQSGADKAANAAAANAGRRLPNDRGFFNPDSQREGGSGTSPKNPWA